VTWALAATVAGLAVLDSFNPATLVAVTLILLASRRRPVAETLAFVTGAFVSVLAVGAAIYLGADAAAGAVAGGLLWIRRAAFGLAALVVLVAAARALRPRRRAAIGLPHWFGPVTAVGLGMAMTAADLPNAFPYLLAIERLVAADLAPPTGLLVLAGYAVVYCLPCLVLLGVGLRRDGRVQDRLRRLHDRYGAAADLPASRWRALGLLVVAIALASVAAATWIT
jgi:cytochrome c biogenesis protein CcdA